MEFGIAMPTDAASWKLAQRAEELGFATAWFYDTQMLSADCFVAMGAAAVKTTRIRLGTGVLIPSNRIAAVTANAFATLNRLAPGRIANHPARCMASCRNSRVAALDMMLPTIASYRNVTKTQYPGRIHDTHVARPHRQPPAMDPGGWSGTSALLARVRARRSSR